MPNRLYNSLNQNGNNMFDLMNQMNALRANPVQFLLQRRLNLPPNFTGGPREIVQYLLTSGQMSQDQFNTLQQITNAHSYR